MIGSFSTKIDGEIISCDILHTFNLGDNKYIIYTTGKKTDDNKLEVNASKYTINNSNEITLFPLEQKEWDLIDKEWMNFYG